MKTIKCPNCYKDLPVSYLVMFLITTLFLILITVGICHAETIPKFTIDNIILSIIGESEGECFEGKIAVAEVIRRRGSLKGVYGINAPRVKKHLYSKETYDLCLKAWLESRFTNYSCLATHWEGSSFKIPYWAKDMKVTARIGNQIFYK